MTYLSRLFEREGVHYHFADDGRLIAGESNATFPAGPSLPYLGHFVAPAPGQVAVSSFRAGGGIVAHEAFVAGWDYLEGETVVGHFEGVGGSGSLRAMRQDVTTQEAAHRQARFWLERERASGSEGAGTSNAPAIRAGRRASLPAFGGAHVVTAARHAGLAGEGCFSYGNAFRAIPDGMTYRPPLRTPVPRLDGVLSAVITNNQDPEELGRIKVKFPAPGAPFESDWIRVGVPQSPEDARVFLPLNNDCSFGNEVMVSFVAGDPRFPTVVGRVYNGVRIPEPPPDRPEVCGDGRDNDCDGLVDEGCV
jgi:uncharacterized protein involved in type VI secretion and phage assembly